MAYFKDPKAYYNYAYGKSIDTDNFPRSQKYQCFDTFADDCKKESMNVDLYCSITGYAGDLYKLRYEKGYDKYFEFFYPKHAQRGDWIFWDRHVAMVWNVDLEKDRVQCLGQNQGGVPYVNLKWYTLSTALGCMRYKEWIKPMNGWIKSNGKWYFFRNGEKLTGWQKLTWSKGESWFYFDKEGVMATGWRLITYKGKKEWFYFYDTGAMAGNCMRMIKDNWYLFDKDGVMQTGTHTVNLEFDSSGALIGGKL